MTDSNGLTIPCGFSPPGSLPVPLPSGIDGGGVFIPTNPPGGFDGEIIINYTPGEPGTPGFPSTPKPGDIPPVIVIVIPTEGETTCDILVVTNIPTDASCGITTVNQPPTGFPFDNGISTNHLFSFTNLLPDTLYNYTLTCKNPPPLKAKTTITGQFTTLADQIDIPDIINPQATFNSNDDLIITWGTSLNGIPIPTTGQVSIFANSQLIFSQLVQLASTHQVIGTGLPFDTDFTVIIQAEIPGEGIKTEALQVQGISTVNIVVGSTQSTSDTITVSWNTIDGAGSPIDSTYQASSIVQGGLFDTYSFNTPLTSHTLTIFDLLPNTLYTIVIKAISGTKEDQEVVVVATQSNGTQPTDTNVTILQNYSNQIYSKYLTNSTYNNSEIDLKVTPYRITPSQFYPTYSVSRTELFNNIRHLSIENILKNETTTLEIANLDYQNISDSHIFNSLDPKLKNILSNLTYSNGVAVPKNKIAKAIKEYLSNSRTDDIDVGYIVDVLSQFSNSNEADVVTLQLPIKKSYGNNINSVKQSRQFFVQPLSQNNNTRSVDIATKILNSNLISLNPDRYNDDSSKFLELWYFLPEDVNKRLEYVNSSGIITSVTINNDESFNTVTSSGPQVYYLTNYLYTTYKDSNGQDVKFAAEYNKDRLFSLRSSDDQLVKYALNVEEETVLSVSCSYSGIELESQPSTLIDSHYLLTLDPLNVTDSFSDNNPFIRESNCRYVLQGKTDLSVSQINNIINYAAYPWAIYTIDYNDPIFDYFTSAYSSSCTFTLRTKDVTLDKYAGNSLDYGPIIPRKLPRYILIIPTDKFQYNPFFGKSYLTTESSRDIRFSRPIDNNLTDVGLFNSPLKIENTFINFSGESKIGEFDTQSYKATYSTTSYIFNNTRKSTQVTRSISAIRKALRVIKSLKDNFDYDKGISYYDVLSRLDRREFYNLESEATRSVLRKITGGDLLGVKLIHTKGSNSSASTRRTDTRLLRLKPNGVDEYSQKYVRINVSDIVSNAIQNTPPEIGEVGEQQSA